MEGFVQRVDDSWRQFRDQLLGELRNLTLPDLEAIIADYTLLVPTFEEGEDVSSYGYINLEGKKEGLWLTWDRDGQLYSEATWSQGQLEGLRRTWYPDGKLESEATWSQGRLEGLRRF